MKGAKQIGTIGLVAALIAFVFFGVSVIAARSHATPVEKKTGVEVYQNNKAVVDASNLSEGYLLIQYTGGKDLRTRVQIMKDQGTTYTYDINNAGSAEVFPLTEGDGQYTVKVYENTTGTKYATAYSCTLNLKLRDEFLPFLYANQFVNYTEKSKVVSVATELVKEKSTELEKLETIYNYAVREFSYDYELAKTVQSSYVPVLDQVMVKKTGICFDYAAVMTAMLRSQKIPCKLVIGYAGNTYHAWINVYIEGQGWVDGAIYFDGKNWSLMDPTFVSTSNKSNNIMKYVTNRNNYSQKFAY